MSIHRSIFFSGVERYASLVIFVVSTAVLSRLLTPSEFGTYAVISALTAVVAASFQEFGGANYIIQRKDLSILSVRSAFTITLAISVLIGIALIGFSTSIAGFFGEAQLKNGLIVAALNFILMPVCGTVSALFRRNLDFRRLAVSSLIATFGGAVTSIALALLGLGFMAPVWGSVASNLILAIGLVLFHGRLTELRPSLFEFRDVLSFGLYSSGVSLINVFYSLAPQLFLAKILNFASVGLYSRAVNITQVFDKFVVQVLNPVVMPAIISRRDSGADLGPVYLESIQLLSVVQWPFLLFFAILSYPIILVWLGESWLEIVPLVRVLCVANMAMFAACLSYPMLVAVGKVRDALLSSAISLPPSLLVILAASFFGVEAVAFAALLTLPFQAAVAIYFISRHLSITTGAFCRALAKSLLPAAATAACAMTYDILIGKAIVSPIAGLSCAILTSAACWLLSLLLVAHPMVRRLQQAFAGLIGAAQLQRGL